MTTIANAGGLLRVCDLRRAELEMLDSLSPSVATRIACREAAALALPSCLQQLQQLWYELPLRIRRATVEEHA